MKTLEKITKFITLRNTRHLKKHYCTQTRPPNTYDASANLRNCTNISNLREIHAHILRNGIPTDSTTNTMLIITYAKHGNITDAHYLYDKIKNKTIYNYNAIMRGYVIHNNHQEVLNLYCQMRKNGTNPIDFTASMVIKACNSCMEFYLGMELHLNCIRFGLHGDPYIGVSLIEMYSNFGKIEFARQVFDEMPKKDVVSWSSMVCCYANSHSPHEALGVFSRMQLQGFVPDSVTLVGALQACARVGAIGQGKCVHGYIARGDFGFDVYVVTALLDMYAKHGFVEIARQVFDKMCAKNIVTWGAMISGYVQNGRARDALMLFGTMHTAKVETYSSTMVSVVSACAHLGALREGEVLHCYILSNDIECSIVLATSLIDMYCKCGRLESARRIFDKMPERNVFSWNAMLAGYGMHGFGDDAVSLFYEMQRNNVKADDVTFVSLLSACGHTGLVPQGLGFFECMSREYGVIPSERHYGCIVDLLGRAGRLDEAERFIRSMPIKPVASVWGALLNSCRMHNNLELAEIAAEHVFELEPECTSAFALLSNMYVSAGRWSDAERIRRRIQGRDV